MGFERLAVKVCPPRPKLLVLWIVPTVFSRTVPKTSLKLMLSCEQTEQLVERFEPGNTLTVEEFIEVLLALQPYADPNSPFENFATDNLCLAYSLDPNTTLIKLEEHDGIMFSIVTSGVMISVIPLL